MRYGHIAQAPTLAKMSQAEVVGGVAMRWIASPSTGRDTLPACRKNYGHASQTSQEEAIVLHAVRTIQVELD
jgi:methyl coenzyme M reductase subunit C